MMRASALLVLIVCTACSTMPQFTVEQHSREDSGSPLPIDSGLPRDGGADGGFDGGPFDGGPFDAGWPDASPDAWVPEGQADFDYDCILYGISPACRQALRGPEPCMVPYGSDECFGLPGFGMAQMYTCQAGVNGWFWTPTQQLRCAYDCDRQLPSSTFFNLSTSNCRARPALPCTLPMANRAGTTQEAVDVRFQQVISECDVFDFAPVTTSGITLDADGCPDVFYSSMARLTGVQRACVTEQLEKLRFDCPTECSLSSTVLLR